jgi:membrane protein required for colicin V production
VGVDLVAAGAILLFALAGAVAGALVQLARLAAIVAGVLLAKPLAGVIAPLLSPLGLEGRAAGWTATALAFAGLYLAFHLGGRGIARLLTEDRELRAVDRAAGGFLGALQAVVVLWVALSAVLLLERAAPRFGIGLPEQGSLAAEATRAYPFFDVAPERLRSPPPGGR